MMDFFNLILQGPLAFVGYGADALVNWIGSCFTTCSAFPQTVWDTFGASVSSIAGFLGSAAANVWTGILYFLPDGGTLPSEFHTAAQYMGDSLATIDFIFPVGTLIYCMSLVLSVKLALWAFHVIRVITGFVRGIPVDSPKLFRL